MTNRVVLMASLAAAASIPAMATAGELTDWLSIDAYLRGRGSVSASGQAGALGNTTKLGRLLNESSKIQIDTEARHQSGAIAHIRLEGETLRGADAVGGALGGMHLTQTWLEYKNALVDGLSIRVGSADYLMGVMQYYDLKPGRVLLETYGIRADYVADSLAFTVTAGDSGYMRSGSDGYHPVPTAAIAASLSDGGMKLAAAAEVFGAIDSPDGESPASRKPGFKLVFGAKYSGEDMLRRADSYLSIEHKMPTADRDDQYTITAGHELEIAAGDAFRFGVGILASWDYAKSADLNALELSPLVRAQYAITEPLHVLAEMAYHARIDDMPGKAETEQAWQGKAGLVLSPAGIGLLTRPHLRLLYGAMHADGSFGQKDGASWKHTFAAEFELKF